MKRFRALAAVAVICAAAESPQQIFERAARSLAAQDYPAAERGFLEVLRAEPRNIGAFGNLGVVYTRTNRYSNAIVTYERALKLVPGDTRLLTNLGLAHMKQEDWAHASATFMAALARDPNNPRLLELDGICRVNTGDLAGAVRSLESARAAGKPELLLLSFLGAAYTKLGQPGKADAIRAEIEQVATPSQAAFFIGRSYYEEGRLEEAAEQFIKAGAHLELGKTYISLRRNEEAERELRLALAADPSSIDANYFLGGLLVLADRPAEAATLLESVVRLSPDAWGAHYYLGRVHLARNSPAKAAASLARAAELNPRESAILYQLSRAQVAAGRADEARRTLARLREMKEQALKDETRILTGSQR